MICRHGEYADLHPFSPVECRRVQDNPYYSADLSLPWRDRAEMAEEHLKVALQDLNDLRDKLTRLRRVINEICDEQEAL